MLNLICVLVVCLVFRLFDQLLLKQKPISFLFSCFFESISHAQTILLWMDRVTIEIIRMSQYGLCLRYHRPSPLQRTVWARPAINRGWCCSLCSHTVFRSDRDAWRTRGYVTQRIQESCLGWWNCYWSRSLLNKAHSLEDGRFEHNFFYIKTHSVFPFRIASPFKPLRPINFPAKLHLYFVPLARRSLHFMRHNKIVLVYN